MLAERQSFQISLQLADCCKVISGRPGGDAEPAGPILRSRGGGGGSHRVVLRWWAWPLPPGGPLKFVCQLGTGETRVSMDAQLILDASQHTVRAWPEDGRKCQAAPDGIPAASNRPYSQFESRTAAPDDQRMHFVNCSGGPPRSWL